MGTTSDARVQFFVLPPRFSFYAEKPGDLLALFLYTSVMLFTVALATTNGLLAINVAYLKIASRVMDRQFP